MRGGHYPVTSHLEWHNCVHVVGTSPKAIADGTVVYVQTPDSAPSTNKDHAQNYPAFGSDPEWTDKGMVILKHTTEIGANGTTPVEITFYSVYAHLKSLGTSRTVIPPASTPKPTQPPRPMGVPMWCLAPPTFTCPQARRYAQTRPAHT